ncbi:ABC transporter permease [Halorubellus sp. JP-L1]|uniref:ABC transporter permease n=1 Tax=Halorubellus sp. JP-L1 TaxID=2715753 RepID=UPI001407FB09|nr:ABC transporter permease [Halorubellus sp. JP-L1]NHN42998.1 ABC transporter permease [Halorubellus sp. JP-L1]
MSTKDRMLPANVKSSIVRAADDYKYPAAFLVAFIGIWTFGVRFYEIPQYVLPTPLDIVTSFDGQFGELAPHMEATLWEAFFGWTVGNFIGITLGAVMAEFTVLKRSIYPYVIMLRSLPVVAFAPLLIIWMGVNTGPILAAATITTFFPSLVNSIAGFSSTDQLTKELMHSLNASRWEVFRKVKLYNAVPYIFSALRISVALAFVGAVVGEWLVGNQGLGYLIIVANNQLDTLLLFRALIIIGAFATAWFGLMMYLERWIVDWGSQASGGATR